MNRVVTMLAAMALALPAHAASLDSTLADISFLVGQ